MDYLAARFGLAAHRWQTYAWSGGRVSVATDLYQFDNGNDVPGGQVDFNQLLRRNFLTALGGTAPAGGDATPGTDPASPSLLEVVSKEPSMPDSLFHSDVKGYGLAFASGKTIGLASTDDVTNARSTFKNLPDWRVSDGQFDKLLPSDKPPAP